MHRFPGLVETDVQANRMKNRQDQNQREKTKKISKQIKTNIFISFIYVDVNYEGTLRTGHTDKYIF